MPRDTLEVLENPNFCKKRIAHRKELATDMAFVFKLMQSVSVKLTEKYFILFDGSQAVGVGKYVEKNENERRELLQEEKVSEAVVLYSNFILGRATVQYQKGKKNAFYEVIVASFLPFWFLTVDFPLFQRDLLWLVQLLVLVVL